MPVVDPPYVRKSRYKNISDAKAIYLQLKKHRLKPQPRVGLSVPSRRLARIVEAAASGPERSNISLPLIESYVVFPPPLENEQCPSFHLDKASELQTLLNEEFAKTSETEKLSSSEMKALLARLVEHMIHFHDRSVKDDIPTKGEITKVLAHLKKQHSVFLAAVESFYKNIDTDASLSDANKFPFDDLKEDALLLFPDIYKLMISLSTNQQSCKSDARVDNATILTREERKIAQSITLFACLGRLANPHAMPATSLFRAKALKGKRIRERDGPLYIESIVELLSSFCFFFSTRSFF